MTSGSPDPGQPDTSFTGYLPYLQANPLRQYEHPVPPPGPHNQYSSTFQRPAFPEQVPFSLTGSQPLHRTAKQPTVVRSATITEITDGGAALYGTDFTIVSTDVNMTTMQITPSIISLFAIILESLITADLLTGGIFFLRGREYKTLLSTAAYQLLFTLCNIVIASTTTFDGIKKGPAFNGNSLLYRILTEPLGLFELMPSFNIIALLLIWQ